MAAAQVLPIRRERHDVRELLKQFQRLKEGRGTFEQHCQEVKDLVLPNGSDFTTQREPGAKRTEKMVDATAALANEKFAAVVESLIAPRSKTWHKLVARDEALNDDPEVKAWLELANKELFAMRSAPRAGFYSAAHEGYKSLGAYGNQCMFVEPRENGGIRYKHVPLADVYVATDPYGQIDTVFYRYRQTAKQSFQQWGDATPPKVVDALKQDPWKEHEYLHIVRPNRNVDTEAVGPRAMSFESIYVCIDDPQVLDQGGYQKMPYVFSRYTVSPGEVYGRGPAMMVLPNIKLLQEMQKTFLRAGHKAVDPPLLVADDGVLGTGGKSIKLKPGGLNYGGLNAQGRPLVAPLITGARLDLTHEMMERERATINAAFLVDLFDVLDQEDGIRTATEVLVRQQEKAQMLGPATGRQESEFQGPLIEIELHTALMQGAIPEPPEQLEAYEIEFTSPAAEMQKTSDVVAIQRLMEVAGPLVQLEPGLLEKFDREEIIDVTGDALGVPSRVIRTDEDYAERRQAADQQAQQMQMAQLAPGVAAAASDAANAASTMQGAQTGAA